MRLDRLPDRYTDTSAYSYHVDTDWYADLDRFRDLLSDDWPTADLADWHAAQSFLSQEARLIDQGRFGDWLDLFAGDGLYWIPVTPRRRRPPAARSATPSTTTAG